MKAVIRNPYESHSGNKCSNLQRGCRLPNEIQNNTNVQKAYQNYKHVQ